MVIDDDNVFYVVHQLRCFKMRGIAYIADNKQRVGTDEIRRLGGIHEHVAVFRLLHNQRKQILYIGVRTVDGDVGGDAAEHGKLCYSEGVVVGIAVAHNQHV